MMPCFQGFRRSLALQLKELNAWKQARQGYCSRAFRVNQQIVESREIRNSYLIGSMLVRMFSGEVSASEQMNLIKQLRERTSAPIKDVESSLVACNYDIEAAQKDLRKGGVVLASKKSSRTVAEDLLAIAQTENKASSLARLALASRRTTQKIQAPLSFDPDYFEKLELCFSKTPPSSVTESASRTHESQVITPKLDESQQSLSHVDAYGQASMVDISSKAESKRVAVAGCRVLLGKKAFDLVAANQIAKGDVLGVAKIAGISGAKQTSSVIPLCHNIGLTHVRLDLTLNEKDYSVDIEGEVATTGKTGVEMEAMTAVTVAGLTVYDMCKAVSKDINITDIHLKHKSGGKSGNWSKNS